MINSKEEVTTEGILKVTTEDVLNTTGSMFDIMLEVVDNSDKELEELEKENKELKETIDKALCSIANCDWNDKYVVETYDILKGSDSND